MKKVSYFIVASLLAVSSVFVSCSDDENVDPALISFDNVQNDKVTLAAGATTYTVNATITSVENLKSVKVTKKIGTETTQVGNTITSFTSKTSYHLSQIVDGITADCEITVTVDNGTESGRSLLITYTPGTPTAGEINTFSTVKMGSLAQSGTDNSFSASIDGTTYSVQNAKENAAKIDFAFFNGATIKNSICAPSNSAVQTLSNNYVAGWATKNATKLKKLTMTATEFDAVADDAKITELVDASVTADIVSNIVANDVYGFIAASGKKGLLKIVSMDTAKNNIVIAIKVQK